MKRTSSLSIVGAALVMLIGLTVWGASATDPMADDTSRAYLHSYSLPSSGVALEGYCPVAYFAANKPVRGRAEFALPRRLKRLHVCVVRIEPPTRCRRDTDVHSCGTAWQRRSIAHCALNVDHTDVKSFQTTR